ncbi:transposase domain-containing protein [Rhizobium leguminosarum]|nr:transposase domain-containing protein [Rhizobium leguminosarum]
MLGPPLRLFDRWSYRDLDPLAYLTATLTAIVNGHKQSRIECLLPWKYPLG